MYELVPDELRQLKQWVCASKDSKAPMMAGKTFPASSSNPETWSSFEDAVKSVEHGEYDYIGFVFADNGIVGIDIDDGYTEDGQPTELAKGIIQHTLSYTEVSRSGRGFHVILKGDLPFTGRNNRNGVEIYKTGRYFIITADSAFGNISLPIKDNQEGIDWVLQNHFSVTSTQLQDGGLTFRQPAIYKGKWGKRDGNRIPLRPHYPDITPGSRNICLTSVAGLMRTIGYPKQAIMDELMHVNQTACKPPLPKREVEMIVSSVMKYKRS